MFQAPSYFDGSYENAHGGETIFVQHLWERLCNGEQAENSHESTQAPSPICATCVRRDSVRMQRWYSTQGSTQTRGRTRAQHAVWTSNAATRWRYTRGETQARSRIPARDAEENSERGAAWQSTRRDSTQVRNRTAASSVGRGSQTPAAYQNIYAHIHTIRHACASTRTKVLNINAINAEFDCLCSCCCSIKE